MEVKATAKFIRMSPRKVRLVASLVRGLTATQAMDQLKAANKKAVEPVIKLLNSAIANATNNFELDKNNLVITEIKVDEGPTLKRWMPRARGRATTIHKRTSHINIILGEIVASGEVKAKKQKVEAPVKLGETPKHTDGVKVKKSEEAEQKEVATEKGKKTSDGRGEGRHGHHKIEGHSHDNKGFMKKMFNRKAG
jgi:large subunit ribosomal protein L22